MISSSRVTVRSSDSELPEAIDLTTVDLTPGDVHPLERYEGMRVTVEDVLVTAPTNQFDEFGISLTGTRAFREPGIEPDVMPDFAGMGLPEWDLNPELVEVDAAETGMAVEQISSLSRATVTGALAYSYNDYQIWPEIMQVTPYDFIWRPVRSRQPGEFTIGTNNVENLFDTVDDPNRDDSLTEDYTPANEEQYALRLAKTSAYIREVMGAPDILALQEAENSRVLTDLALQLHADDSSLRYAGCLLEGNEGRGIDVAYLVRVDQVNIIDCYRIPGALEAVNDSNAPLVTRPPLVLEAEYIQDGQAFPITLINVHIKSLSGIEETHNQARRLFQAELIANYVQQRQTENPDIHLAILGDFNAFQFTDGLVDVVGIISGNEDPAGARMQPEGDLVEPNLVNQVLQVPEEDRYSYIYNGSAQVLDHVLTSSGLEAFVSAVQFGRGNADTPRLWFLRDQDLIHSSDHDGLVIFIQPGLGEE
ncbi:MAG: endonuclease/exonuclease/phosphatase family protein [Anaerolineae bacterium]|nr:endonuclease/exonuclease/phosphatase family protein [Anaerolineae bacterium]